MKGIDRDILDTNLHINLHSISKEHLNFNNNTKNAQNERMSHSSAASGSQANSTTAKDAEQKPATTILPDPSSKHTRGIEQLLVHAEITSESSPAGSSSELTAASVLKGAAIPELPPVSLL